MDKRPARAILLFIGLIAAVGTQSQLIGQTMDKTNTPFQPLSYEEASRLADSTVSQMTLDEKIAMIGGDKHFFIRALPRLNLSEVYMADATQGVHLRKSFQNVDLSTYQLEKSTAFPAPILLAATWNPCLAYRYARAIGEECRAGDIGILLGPGINAYRQSQCGRNFEYFGEDPFLAASLIGKYVKGVQSTGTVATLKHFIANNTEYYRRKSNSIIDERTLHEIYLPAFKAGIDAGAKAVMTSYNLVNGEWCGQSDYVINHLLREQLDFRWLVMTDWWSVSDGEKLAKSGQDLEMPFAIALRDARKYIAEGKVSIEDIDRMATSIVRTCFAMKLYERKPDSAYLEKYDEHVEIALQTAREGIVLLKNDHKILPVKDNAGTILLTGDWTKKLACGGGAASVEGYNNRMMLDELKAVFGDRLRYVKNPSSRLIKAADIVLCNIGTHDSEGWDRPFALPRRQAKKVRKCVEKNPNTVVIVTSGSGIRMTDWNAKAGAILYTWYGGQIGNRAIAEIVAGKTNPSGKLPITIEKEFEDSPGFGYLPEGEKLYRYWDFNGERNHPVYDIEYKEGIFTGYRWYDQKEIEPLYPFGHGLSYSNFEYSNLQIDKEVFKKDDVVIVSFSITNSGDVAGMETAQLYIQDLESSVPRPHKELKGFQKVKLEPGQSETVSIKVCKKAFSFWNPKTGDWFAEKGNFKIVIGASSRDIRLEKVIELQ